MKQILLYLGALLPVFWGGAHVFPTRSVVAGFGDISLDNRRIITMEWIGEAVALVFVGGLVAVVTLIDARHSLAQAVYLLCAAMLIVLAIVSLFTGFKIQFLPFKACPIIFTMAAILILAGAWL